MNKGQRTVSGLLTVIAVLLGFNLLASGHRTADAQTDGMAGPVPISIASSASGGSVRLFRLWDDGTIESKLLNFSGGASCDIVGGCDWFDITNCSGDLDGSGAVDFPDLVHVLGKWGPCPE